MVRGLGGDHVIDYTAEDHRSAGKRYDLIVDMASRGGIMRQRGLLKPGGGYVVIGGTGRAYLEAATIGSLMTLVTNRKMGILMWRVDDTRNMADLVGMLESGAIAPHIDRTYQLSDIADAMRSLESGAAKGKTAISVQARYSVGSMAEPSVTRVALMAGWPRLCSSDES